MRRAALAVLSLLPLAAAACASWSTSDAPVSPPPAVSHADKAYAGGAAALREGHHEKALELFATAWKENPGHPGVGQDFFLALEGLKKSGDEAAWQGRAEDAGKRWAAALKHLSHPAVKGKVVPFTKADLRGSIDRLSDGLLEKGLVEYRQGNIEKAIAVWRSILAYDPSHEEALKSVRTATTQLENLKKLPAGK